MALQALGDWADAACGPARGGRWDAGVDERPASEGKLWCFGVRLCGGFYPFDVSNSLILDLTMDLTWVGF